MYVSHRNSYARQGSSPPGTGYNMHAVAKKPPHSERAIGTVAAVATAIVAGQSMSGGTPSLSSLAVAAVVGFALSNSIDPGMRDTLLGFGVGGILGAAVAPGEPSAQIVMAAIGLFAMGGNGALLETL